MAQKYLFAEYLEDFVDASVPAVEAPPVHENLEKWEKYGDDYIAYCKEYGYDYETID